MNHTTHDEQSANLPQPEPERDTGHLPDTLTFFMTRAQRTRVLRALREDHNDRTRALLCARGLSEGAIPRKGVRR